MHNARERRLTWLVSLGLVLGIALVYGQLWRADFVTFDDPEYVKFNPYIQHGITWTSLRWAFTSGYAENWHPATWISHMVDIMVYGPRAGGHHMTNVLLHAADSVLLFLVLKRMTRAFWPSAMVAALFAFHPSHVESVAWISERKDVLSTMFWLLSLGAFIFYCQQKLPAEKPWQTRPWWLSILFFSICLMAKPMGVTFPFVLLLLDVWPLQRTTAGWRLRIVEKIPYMVLAGISSALTLHIQTKAIIPVANFGFSHRLQNVVFSYTRYLGKIFWPAKLAMFYPFFGITYAQWIGASLGLVLFSVLAVWQTSRRPWLFVGWFWFLGTLIPVIGLVQPGLQSMADRYLYIPAVGIFIAVVWTAAGLTKLRKFPVIAIGCAVLLTCLGLTQRQVSYWKSSLPLYQHTFAVTAHNYFVLGALGSIEVESGMEQEGVSNLLKSIELAPDFELPRHALAHFYLSQNKIKEALRQAKQAVFLANDAVDARMDYGFALLATNRIGDALDQFQAAVNVNPDFYPAQQIMGEVLFQNKDFIDAIPFLENAVRIEPTNAHAHSLLADDYLNVRRTRDALEQYQQTILLSPTNFQAVNNLAWVGATDPNPALRDGALAVKLAAKAVQLTHSTNASIWGTFAAACAEVNRPAEAVAASRRACTLAANQKNSELLKILQEQLAAYEAGRKWRSTN